MVLELFGGSKEDHFWTQFGTPLNWVLNGNLIKNRKDLREMENHISGCGLIWPRIEAACFFFRSPAGQGPWLVLFAAPTGQGPWLVFFAAPAGQGPCLVFSAAGLPAPFIKEMDGLAGI